MAPLFHRNQFRTFARYTFSAPTTPQSSNLPQTIIPCKSQVAAPLIPEIIRLHLEKKESWDASLHISQRDVSSLRYDSNGMVIYYSVI